jgi:hypothetical protein
MPEDIKYCTVEDAKKYILKIIDGAPLALIIILKNKLKLAD